MALSTFSDLKTELTNQGFDYLSSTQQGDYINTAYQEVCGLLPWPFLETSTSVTSGSSISDLRQVLYVRDPTADVQLCASDTRSLIDWYGSLTDTGDPSFWYLDGQTTLKTYPVNASRSVTVGYIKVPTALSGNSDQPLVPLSYRMVLVYGAKCIAHLENGDYEAEQAARGVWQQYVDRMASALLGRNLTATPDTVIAEPKNY